MASGTYVNCRIKTDYVDYAYSLGPNESGNTNLKTLIDSKMPSGGVCIGIIGYSSNAGAVIPSSLRYVNTEYSLQFYNFGTTSQTRSFRVYFAYI